MKEITPIHRGDRTLRADDFNAAFEELKRLGRMRVEGCDLIDAPGGTVLIPQEVTAIALAVAGVNRSVTVYPSVPEKDADPYFGFPFKILNTTKFNESDLSERREQDPGTEDVVVYNLLETFVPSGTVLPLYRWNEQWWCHYNAPRHFQLEGDLRLGTSPDAYQCFYVTDGSGDAADLGTGDHNRWKLGGKKFKIDGSAFNGYAKKGYRGVAQLVYRDGTPFWYPMTVHERARIIQFQVAGGLSGTKVYSWAEGIHPNRPYPENSSTSARDQIAITGLHHSENGAIGTAIRFDDGYICIDMACPADDDGFGGGSYG